MGATRILFSMSGQEGEGATLLSRHDNLLSYCCCSMSSMVRIMGLVFGVVWYWFWCFVDVGVAVGFVLDGVGVGFVVLFRYLFCALMLFWVFVWY